VSICFKRAGRVARRETSTFDVPVIGVSHSFVSASESELTRHFPFDCGE
jgi:hypothetical protein